MAAAMTTFADSEVVEIERNARIEQLLSIRKKVTSFFRGKSDELQSIKECRVISSDYILDFSRYTTFTLGAPEGWVPGMPLIGGHPPAPQPDQMRDGVLQRFNQQRPVLIVAPPVVPTKVMKDIVKKEQGVKPVITENISLPTKRPADEVPQGIKVVKQEIEVKEEAMEKEERISLAPVPAPVPVSSVRVSEDQQPHKRARQINISFGLSDSESSEEEGDN